MLLSIITICYNEAQRIELTLNSVVSQIFTSFQYIVIDGSSDDGTIDIIEKFSANIDVFISEPDKGIYNAMNKGLKKAKGDYVLFLNGGDYFYNHNVLIDVFRFCYNEDILYGYLTTQDNKDIKKLANTNIRQYLRTNTLPHQATFVKKSIFDKTSGFDESFTIAGDYHFFVRAILEYNASTKYIPVRITVFNLDGISQNAPQVLELEKRNVQKLVKNLSPPRSLTRKYVSKLLALSKKNLPKLHSSMITF